MFDIISVDKAFGQCKAHGWERHHFLDALADHRLTLLTRHRVEGETPFDLVQVPLGVPLVKPPYYIVLFGGILERYYGGTAYQARLMDEALGKPITAEDIRFLDKPLWDRGLVLHAPSLPLPGEEKKSIPRAFFTQVRTFDLSDVYISQIELDMVFGPKYPPLELPKSVKRKKWWQYIHS